MNINAASLVLVLASLAVAPGVAVADGFIDPGAWNTCDPGDLGIGVDPDGFWEGVFDGRYLYFVPHHNGTDNSGEFLRLDTFAPFCEDTSWMAYNPADDGVGSDPRGYSGGAFDGRYIFFAPTSRSGNAHGEVLRYDTTGPFADPLSWASYDRGENGGCTDPDGFVGAVFDGRYVYFVAMHNGRFASGEFLRYDTWGDFDDPSSWACCNPESLSVGTWLSGYRGGTFDGRYVYFAPSDNENDHSHGKVLRLDILCGFCEPACWTVFDAKAEIDAKGGYYGAVYDGERYVYFVPNGGPNRHAEVLRYDTQGSFIEPASWEKYDPGDHGVGTDPGAFAFADFDGRYVYFAAQCPGEVMRYDTVGDFMSPDSWSTYVPGEASDRTDADGYVGAVWDGTYVYFIPYHDCKDYYGEVLRYDTTFCVSDIECEDGDRCTTHICVGNVCKPCEYKAADIDQNCVVNVFDAFCVLDAIAGDDHCSRCP